MDQSEVVELARSRPWAEQAWAEPILQRFPEVLRQAVERWGLRIERAYVDGVGLPLIEVRRGELPAVVKFEDAGTDLAQQVAVMAAAGGVGYCRVLESATDLGAALLERLGPSLTRTVPDPSSQHRILADLLEQAWQVPLEVAIEGQPEEKAGELLAILETEAEEAWLRPYDDIITTAASLAGEIHANPGTDVVCVHGDPHSLNALRRGADDYAFIDPDGFRCEREYDVAVVLRDLIVEVEDVAGGPGGSAAARRWHAGQVRDLSARLGVDADRVEAWASVERCTTGIWLHRLGYADEGERWLRSAVTLLR